MAYGKLRYTSTQAGGRARAARDKVARHGTFLVCAHSGRWGRARRGKTASASIVFFRQFLPHELARGRAVPVCPPFDERKFLRIPHSVYSPRRRPISVYHRVRTKPNRSFYPQLTPHLHLPTLLLISYFIFRSYFTYPF